MTRVFAAHPSCLCVILALGLLGCDASKPAHDTDTSANVQRIERRSESTSESASNSTEPAEPALFDREQRLNQATRLMERGQFAEAASTLTRLLVADPDDVEVLFMLANLDASQGNLAAGIEKLDAIPREHPEAGIPALGQSADWCMELGRYEDAEQRYRDVLRIVPDAYPARRQLAFLLNCQGRRHEAAVEVRELCKLGNVRQDELHSLIMLSHAMHDDPDKAGDAVSTGGREQGVIYAPIGPGGVARKLFTDGKFSEAADVLEASVESGTAPAALVALYGRAVVEAQDDRRFLSWLSQVDDATRDTADYWAAIGTYLISQRRFEEATRALLEAADRDPTDMYSFGRLGQTLLTLDDADGSQRWIDRWDEINELIKANNRLSETSPPDPDRMADLIVLLEKLNRPLEAVLWKSIEDHQRGAMEEQQVANNDRLQQLVASDEGFASREDRLCGIDLNAYPLPSLEAIQRRVAGPSDRRAQPAKSPTAASFLNVAAKLGLNHAYQVAAKPQSEGFAIYQTYGGAVACLDFDLDGNSDLYFAQGGSDPPSFQGPLSNQLYRNMPSAGGRQSGARGDDVGEDSVGEHRAVDDAYEFKMLDVTASAEATDFRYSMGVTAGDWNQDGFADLVVANLGDDTLLINNGDGTFRHTPVIDPHDQFRVPASVAIADLTGDGLPDIFELSYVDDPEMIFLPKRNEARQVIKAMSPMQYAPGADRICINDGSGGMSIQQFNTDETDYRSGLGLIVTNFDQKPGNEVFVGNDLYPDQLWVRDATSGGWSDIAPAVGCAFGIRGSKTASMGIAVGDVDNSGTIDIHISNYQNRNSSLFLNLGESFLEKNVQYGLAEASQAVLGFGTQTLDYDNDGLLDLVVTNGHIEKAITIDEPFEQPAQLFSNVGGRFKLIDVNDPSGYWGRKHLGRGLARVDLNRDGKQDFVVTHLGEPSAILLNQTDTQGHWLQVQLVGVESERDAVGAKVTVESSVGSFRSWVTAGDGYMVRNQPVVAFGLGEANAPVRVTVDWPDGKMETFEKVATDQRMLIIEGSGEAFSLSDLPQDGMERK